MIEVVSGGQTGVDQAGLKIAKEMGFTVGGWCPKGGHDEMGFCVLETYPELKQASTPNPDERTKLNIDHSDGTLIIVPQMPLPDKIKDGTRLTIDYAEEQRKPVLIINLSQKDEAIDRILSWIDKNNIRILNIAGPRESNWPGIHDDACVLFRELFAHLNPRPSPG